MSSKTPSKRKSAKAPKAPSKSKLIKDAHKALVKVLKEHAEITAGSGVSLKKAQRSGAKLAAAAVAYAEAVQAKTGLESPFVPGNGKLDGETIKSLQAERSELEKAVTGSIPVLEAAEPEPVTATEAAPAAETPATTTAVEATPAEAAPKKAPARRTTTPRAATSGATTPRATRTTAAPSTTGTRRTNSSIGTAGTTPAPRTRRAAAPKPVPEADAE